MLRYKEQPISSLDLLISKQNIDTLLQCCWVGCSVPMPLRL
ncbi:hypothetical protein [Candidatus Hodgkinia cicadicola]